MSSRVSAIDGVERKGLGMKGAVGSPLRVGQNTRAYILQFHPYRIMVENKFVLSMTFKTTIVCYAAKTSFKQK